MCSTMQFACGWSRNPITSLFMILTIIIAFISLMGLMVLHEFGHFILAKRFGVDVEEFGIGYPPRIFGKKIGETIYSINALPFGAFVKIRGEIGGIESSRNFSGKPIWQRVLIVIGGVVSFWIISAILLSFVMGFGAPTAISDEENGRLINPKVQIVAVVSGSPAEIAGIKAGDAIKKISIGDLQISTDKVKEVQNFIITHKGEKITLTIERGKEVFTTSLISRVSPPSGEGPMGVALARTAIKSYPWYQAIWRGILGAYNLTIAVIQGWTQALTNVSQGLPSGVELMGPVGIFSLFTQVSQLGINYFLQFVAMISIYLALFNILPIPSVDGGKLLFLGIEAIRKRPVSERTEQKVTTFFFSLLILLMIFVTIKDVIRIF
jgi:regulator of sigma E protease